MKICLLLALLIPNDMTKVRMLFTDVKSIRSVKS